mmetsp:Transcript_46615/g.109650  ORF Transcript_46615/g.109650 Transcript_46615/m.109650 type:complete len:898 (-) Transcript_46615:2023-4716(-)
MAAAVGLRVHATRVHTLAAGALARVAVVRAGVLATLAIGAGAALAFAIAIRVVAVGVAAPVRGVAALGRAAVGSELAALIVRVAALGLAGRLALGRRGVHAARVSRILPAHRAALANAIALLVLVTAAALARLVALGACAARLVQFVALAADHSVRLRAVTVAAAAVVRHAVFVAVAAALVAALALAARVVVRSALLARRGAAVAARAMAALRPSADVLAALALAGAVLTRAALVSLLALRARRGVAAAARAPAALRPGALVVAASALAVVALRPVAAVRKRARQVSGALVAPALHLAHCLGAARARTLVARNPLAAVGGVLGALVAHPGGSIAHSGARTAEAAVLAGAHVFAPTTFAAVARWANAAVIAVVLARRAGAPHGLVAVVVGEAVARVAEAAIVSCADTDARCLLAVAVLALALVARRASAASRLAGWVARATRAVAGGPVVADRATVLALAGVAVTHAAVAILSTLAAVAVAHAVSDAAAVAVLVLTVGVAARAGACRVAVIAVAAVGADAQVVAITTFALVALQTDAALARARDRAIAIPAGAVASRTEAAVGPRALVRICITVCSLARGARLAGAAVAGAGTVALRVAVATRSDAALAILPVVAVAVAVRSNTVVALLSEAAVGAYALAVTIVTVALARAVGAGAAHVVIRARVDAVTVAVRSRALPARRSSAALRKRVALLARRVIPVDAIIVAVGALALGAPVADAAVGSLALAIIDAVDAGAVAVSAGAAHGIGVVRALLVAARTLALPARIAIVVSSGDPALRLGGVGRAGTIRPALRSAAPLVRHVVTIAGNVGLNELDGARVPRLAAHRVLEAALAAAVLEGAGLGLAGEEIIRGDDLAVRSLSVGAHAVDAPLAAAVGRGARLERVGRVLHVPALVGQSG